MMFTVIYGQPCLNLVANEFRFMRLGVGSWSVNTVYSVLCL